MFTSPKQSIGIIGNTGRMGVILTDLIKNSEIYTLGKSFNTQVAYPIHEVFQENDFVVDFSSHVMILDILKAAQKYHKPLIICSTGWKFDDYKDLINQLSSVIPVIIAPNTSFGAAIHKALIEILAKTLDASYDIDITDKHHRYKIDMPSGTAHNLINTIKDTKLLKRKEDYTVQYGMPDARNHIINVHIERSGNLPGEHEVSFTSLNEMISIKHVAFDRKLFAEGAIKIIQWLNINKPTNGLYNAHDIYFSSSQKVCIS